jgi:hypothetical protein
MLTLIFFIIFTALVFDFLNGFHDAANSIATVVATRVLTPTQAVVWAAAFNFVAAFLFGTKVAGTISADMVDNKLIDIYVVFGGLVGAIIWNIITWLLGLPTSSSHALIGGLGGAAVIKSGVAALVPTGWMLVAIGIVCAPIFGFILGTLIMVLIAWVARRETPHRMDRVFRKLQLASAALYSLGHGGNDAQKTMGIIVMLLAATRDPRLIEWTKGNPHSFHAPLPPLRQRRRADRLVDHPRVPRRHRAGHDVRRVAHRQNHGPQHHPPPARRRLLRRDGGGDHDLRLHENPRRADLDHSRDHRRDPRRGDDARRALGPLDLGTAHHHRWILTIPCAAFMARSAT